MKCAPLLKRGSNRRCCLEHGAVQLEIHERERAAADMERLNEGDRAEALRAEALLAKRYLEPNERAGSSIA